MWTASNVMMLILFAGFPLILLGAVLSMVRRYRAVESQFNRGGTNDGN